MSLWPFGRLAWTDVVVLVWFGLTAISVAYVAWDAKKNNPELTVMKWGWLLVTLYMGPVALFLYVMSCKEPYPGSHERFVTPLWKQGWDQPSIASRATPPASSSPRLLQAPLACPCRSIW